MHIKAKVNQLVEMYGAGHSDLFSSVLESYLRYSYVTNPEISHNIVAEQDNQILYVQILNSTNQYPQCPIFSGIWAFRIPRKGANEAVIVSTPVEGQQVIIKRIRTFDNFLSKLIERSSFYTENYLK